MRLVIDGLGILLLVARAPPIPGTIDRSLKKIITKDMNFAYAHNDADDTLTVTPTGASPFSMVRSMESPEFF